LIVEGFRPSALYAGESAVSRLKFKDVTPPVAGGLATVAKNPSFAVLANRQKGWTSP